MSSGKDDPTLEPFIKEQRATQKAIEKIFNAEDIDSQVRIDELRRIIRHAEKRVHQLVNPTFKVSAW
jgi:hypothetical protein